MKLYCIVCGNEFETIDGAATRCPACAPTAQADGSPGAAPEPVQGAEEPEAPLEWKEGDVILGTYEVRGVLGKGGMGSVLRVHHRGWGLDLAVKSPLPEAIRTPAQRDLFVTEAQTWVNLGLHPHIASCYYVRTLGGVPRIFAECVEGGSLASWIAAGRLTSLEQLLDTALQFAWGLDFAHECGLVHQDVKPANVLMAPDGTAKVSDFGLARARAAAAPGSGTASFVSHAGGYTPAYCSPEQAAGGALTLRTDIWSFGLSILEMFAGEAFWTRGAPTGATGQLAPQALAHLVQEGPSQPGLPRMPQALTELLRECFAPEPKQRVQTMAEVASRLASIFKTACGREPPRQKPQAATLRADALNNQGASLWDLGKTDDAKKVLREAILLEPLHPEATANLALLEWREPCIADDEVVRRLENVRNRDRRAGLLLGLVHLERGACAEAEKELENALRASEDAGDASPWRALGEARLAQGSFGQARESFLRARGISSTDRSVEQGLACCEKGTREPEGRLLYPWRRPGSPLKGEQQGKTVVCLSPDGRTCYAGAGHEGFAGGGGVSVWDIATGKSTLVIGEREGNATAVCVTGDGSRILYGGGSRDQKNEAVAIRLCDAQTGGTLRTYAGHDRGISGLAILPDRKRFLSASWDGDLRLWNVESGECLARLQGPAWRQGVGGGQRVPQIALALYPETHYAAAGDIEGNVRLWNLDSGECIRAFAAHEKWALALAALPDGQRLLSGGWGGSLKLWDLATGQCLRIMTGHESLVSGLAVSRDGRQALSASHDGTVRIWDLATGQCTSTLASPCGNVLGVALTPDERMAFGGAANGSVAVFHVELDGPSRRAAIPPRRFADAARLAAREREFLQAIAAAEGARQGGNVRQARQELAKARGIGGFENDARALRLNTTLGWGLPRSALHAAWPTGELRGHTSSVNSVVISRDGSLAVSGGGEEGTSRDAWTVKVWDLASGRLQRDLLGAGGPVHFLEWAGTDTHVTGWSDDGQKRTWDVATGACVATGAAWERGQNALRSAMAATPDRSIVVCGDTLAPTLDENFAVWFADDGSERWRRSREEHKAHILAVRAGRENEHVFSASEDGTLRLWRISDGECLRVFAGHRGGVTAFDVTADGRFLVSGGTDKTLRVWEVGTGECAAVLRGHLAPVTSVAVPPQGGRVISADRSGVLVVWEFDFDYADKGNVDWDDGTLPYLRIFLRTHPPKAGKRTWTSWDLPPLSMELRDCGFGWVNFSGINRRLERMEESGDF